MLAHALKNLSFVERFYSYPVLRSTNDTARELREFPEKGIFVIQADRQIAGRGRSGAAYFSDIEGGIWSSIVAPLPSIENHFIHNRALSLAVCGSLEAATGASAVCSVKWPNDVYWAARKICGVLLENHPARPDVLILGFGVNVNIAAADFPPELREIATSLFIETNRRFSLSTLLNDIVQRYHNPGTVLEAHRTYEQRLLGVGRAAEIDGEKGIFDGVEPDGRARLKQERKVIYKSAGHLLFSAVRTGSDARD